MPADTTQAPPKPLKFTAPERTATRRAISERLRCHTTRTAGGVAQEG
jgi:hypothetical protein